MGTCTRESFAFLLLSIFAVTVTACQDADPVEPRPDGTEASSPDPVAALSAHTEDQGTGEELEGSESFVAPSTNELNKLKEVPGREGQDAPYVVFEAIDAGEVTLRFVNNTNSLAFFERRIDGKQEGDEPHPVVNTETEHRTTGKPALLDDVIHPGVSLDGRGKPDPVEEVETFQAGEIVEIRLALGGERDWDFDWTAFYVGGCKDGEWKVHGFRNQGQCIRYLNTGTDSREESVPPDDRGKGGPVR